MKLNGLVYYIVALVLAGGCVQSHRAPVVYSDPNVYAVPSPVDTAPPAAPVEPVPPVSTRPEARVYPAPGTEVMPAPIISYGTSEADLALAHSIRRMLSADTSLASAARNMRMSIRDGRITLTGTAPSENARQLVERTLANTAGVVSVDDQSQLEFR